MASTSSRSSSPSANGGIPRGKTPQTSERISAFSSHKEPGKQTDSRTAHGGLTSPKATTRETPFPKNVPIPLKPPPRTEYGPPAIPQVEQLPDHMAAIPFDFDRKKRKKRADAPRNQKTRHRPKSNAGKNPVGRVSRNPRLTLRRARYPVPRE